MMVPLTAFHFIVHIFVKVNGSRDSADTNVACWSSLIPCISIISSYCHNNIELSPTIIYGSVFHSACKFYRSLFKKKSSIDGFKF